MATDTYTSPMDNFESTLEDSILGPELESDHNRPPAGSYTFGPAYDGTCFILKDNYLYYSKPKQPEYWPALYYVEVSPIQFPLQTGLIHNGQIFVFSKKDVYYVQGTGDQTFLPFKRDAKTGAQSIRGAVSVTGRGIYHTGPDGIYLFSSGSDTKITEQTLEPIFRGATTEGIPGVATMSGSWLFNHSNYLYFGYRAGTENYPANILVMNLDTNKLAYYIYNDGSNVQVSSITTDLANDRILIGDSTGFVREIESASYTDDSGTAISFDVKSKDFTLQTRAHFPRWVKYDVDASASGSVTGTLLLDGASHQTHTITGTRDTKRRLVGTGNGSRAAIQISGTGPTSIYLTEFE